MSQTARFDLPLLEAGQAQKEVTHNEAMTQIDALLHLVVDSRTIVTPPVAGSAGTWIVPVGGTDAWASRAGQIAVLDAAGWSYVTPPDGCVGFVRDEQVFIVCQGGTWRDSWPIRSLTVGGRVMLGGPLAAVVMPAGGITIDAEARAALSQLVTALAGLGLLAVN